MTHGVPSPDSLGDLPVTVPDAALGLLILSQMTLDQRHEMTPVEYEALLGPNTLANGARIIETALGTIAALLRALAASSGVSNDEMFERWRRRMVAARGADGNVPPQ